jgi:hypothetical protein
LGLDVDPWLRGCLRPWSECSSSGEVPTADSTPLLSTWVLAELAAGVFFCCLPGCFVLEKVGRVEHSVLSLPFKSCRNGLWTPGKRNPAEQELALASVANQPFPRDHAHRDWGPDHWEPLLVSVQLI